MTSRIIVDQIEGSSGGGNIITVPAGHNLVAPGHVLQVKTIRVDAAVAYATGTSGVEMTDMRVSITPKKSTSMILCMFMMFGEGAGTHEYMYRMYKNGSLITGTYAGYNTVQGNQGWSGISMSIAYESDYNSTPDTRTFMYYDYPATTSTVTYAPGIVSAGSSPWYMNRTVGSTGTASYENGVSIGTLWEIAV
jgi:hypothetical protein